MTAGAAMAPPVATAAGPAAPAAGAGHASAAQADAAHLTACTECGSVQRLPPMRGRNVLDCAVCASTLERRGGRSLDAALACSAAGLLMLLAANLQPFLTTSIFGAARQSRLVSSATAMFDNGYPELALAVGLFVVVLPVLRLGLLTAVLGALRLGRRPRWLGGAFRYAATLEPWAMADVFLVACVVAVLRLRTELTVEMEAGAWCFVAGALLTLLVRATLDPPAVWQAIAPERSRPPASPPPFAPTPATAAIGRSDVGPEAAALMQCPGCDLLQPLAHEGRACPRCAARLRARKPGSVPIAAALTLAAALLYLPANLYPMTTLPIGLLPTRFTVLEGVHDLIDYHLWGLAIVVLLASFVIPLAKLAGLAWCIASVLRCSRRHLRLKTRAFLIIEEIGRWSMIDPFVLACFVPITQYNAFIYGRAEPAAPAFAAVVILTTFAALRFDPRLMWDAARRAASAEAATAAVPTAR